MNTDSRLNRWFIVPAAVAYASLVIAYVLKGSLTILIIIVFLFLAAATAYKYKSYGKSSKLER